MQRVYLVPYNPEWPEEYARESALVAAVLGDSLVEIHHIGSTAIRGMASKPIIDLLGVASELAAIDSRSARLVALGYEPMGEFGIPGRRYFRKNDASGERMHQLHLFASGSAQIERHLAFRDYMRVHPTEAAEYAALKARLAADFPEDIGRYTDGKDEFIREMDARASAWRAQKHGAL